MRVARAVRPALVLALATTGLAAPAIAKPKPAPKPVCHLVTDPEGDAKRHPIAGAPVAIFDSPALDITSADVATGKKTVSVVVRVKTTDVTADPYAPLGFAWTFQWKIKDTTYAVQRSRNLDSSGKGTYKDTFVAAGRTSDLPAGTKTSMDATSYSWVLPRNAVPELKKPHQWLTGFSAVSSVFSGNADAAGSNASYLDQYPSCLRPS